MKQSIIIADQFCGPPGSGNGGYTCGCLANSVLGAAEVTLLVPPPLERPLTVVPEGENGVALMDGDRKVARAVPGVVDIAVPPLVSYEQALAASGRHPWMDLHVFPECFVCGPARAEADGLRLFAGTVPGSNAVAAPWVPAACFADPNGQVKDEIIWAALDCPGAWAATINQPRAIVLGRFTVELLQPVRAGEKYIIQGWIVSREGRKTLVGTALYNANGQLHAKAKAIWVDLKS